MTLLAHERQVCPQWLLAHKNIGIFCLPLSRASAGPAPGPGPAALFLFSRTEGSPTSAYGLFLWFLVIPDSFFLEQIEPDRAIRRFVKHECYFVVAHHMPGLFRENALVRFGAPEPPVLPLVVVDQHLERPVSVG